MKITIDTHGTTYRATVVIDGVTTTRIIKDGVLRWESDDPRVMNGIKNDNRIGSLILSKLPVDEILQGSIVENPKTRRLFDTWEEIPEDFNNNRFDSLWF